MISRINPGTWRYRWHGLVLAILLALASLTLIFVMSSKHNVVTAQIVVSVADPLVAMRDRLADGRPGFTLSELIDEGFAETAAVRESINQATNVGPGGGTRIDRRGMTEIIESVEFFPAEKWNTMFRISLSMDDPQQAVLVLNGVIDSIRPAGVASAGSALESGEAGTGADGAGEFKILEPPAVASYEDALGRTVIAFLTIVVCALAGALLVFILNRQYPRMRNGIEDVEIAGANFVADIPHTSPDSVIRTLRKEVLVFGLIVSMVLVVYVILFALL